MLKYYKNAITPVQLFCSDCDRHLFISGRYCTEEGCTGTLNPRAEPDPEISQEDNGSVTDPDGSVEVSDG